MCFVYNSILATLSFFIFLSTLYTCGIRLSFDVLLSIRTHFRLAELLRKKSAINHQPFSMNAHPLFHLDFAQLVCCVGLVSSNNHHMWCWRTHFYPFYLMGTAVE